MLFDSFWIFFCSFWLPLAKRKLLSSVDSEKVAFQVLIRTNIYEIAGWEQSAR